MEKLAAVSVDLDEIDCYAAIHGLAEAGLVTGDALHAVYRKTLSRLLALFAELDIPATFFAIGRDLASDENCARIRDAAAKGHEIANHSLNHYYDLTRRDEATQRLEVSGGADVIEAVTGRRPRGFRAPGYTITDGLFEVLKREGVHYDSSVFPCPPYYLAKAAAIGLIRVRGRESRSIVDDPRVLTAPADPYRIGVPYYRRGDGLCELPIGVTRDLSGRLPYIGTSVVLWGKRGARLLTQLVSARRFVNLELHGIDLADAAADELEGLLPYQPDLKRSADEKRAALLESVTLLKTKGFSFVTLEEAARRCCK